MAHRRALEVLEQQAIPLGLLGRGERMHGRKLRPRDRHHLGGRVELHRARAERDHAAVERQIAIGQSAHVTQQLGLGAIAVKHRMIEERACGVRGRQGGRAVPSPRDRRKRSHRRRRARPPRPSRRSSSRLARCRAPRWPSAVGGGNDPEIDPLGSGAGDDLRLPLADRDRQGVEEARLAADEIPAVASRPPGPRSCGRPRVRSRSAPPVHGRSRTSRR